jgi:hypothetical protein
VALRLSFAEHCGCSPVSYTVMRRLTTGTRSEKCVVRQFRRCANVKDCSYTNLDSTAYYRYASLNDGDTF